MVDEKSQTKPLVSEKKKISFDDSNIAAAVNITSFYNNLKHIYV